MTEGKQVELCPQCRRGPAKNPVACRLTPGVAVVVDDGGPSDVEFRCPHGHLVALRFIRPWERTVARVGATS